MNGVARALARALVPRGARNWLRAPGRSAAWIWDDVRHRCGWDRAARLRPDWSVRCHPAAYRLAYAPYLTDPAQAAELAGFVSTCRPGMVLFDVGAHFGVFSLAALHYGGPQARAVAIEPSPSACRMLGVQAALNGASDRLTIVRGAAAARSGQQAMVPIGVIAAGYYSGATAGYGAADLAQVRAVTLDDLVEECGAWPTHVKIDVEGAEADVLAGARRVLTAGQPPMVFIELHNRMVREQGGDPARATGLLRDLGYTAYAPDGTAQSAPSLLAQPLVRVIARRTLP